jgi:DNA repair exonuclease SbcCD nuclease subunit
MSDTFAHIADTHLRSFQHGRSYRGKDFFNSFKNVIEQVAKLGIKTIIHGGDLLDIRNPSSEVINQLCQLNALALKHNIDIYVVTGNHDKCEPSWVTVLSNILLSANQSTAIWSLDYTPVTLSGGTKIYGLPYLNSADLKDALATAPAADFLVWHGAVKEFCNFPSQDAVNIDLFAETGKYKNVLLGDIHISKYLPFGANQQGVIGYPGSLELCEAGEAQEKFFSVITYDGVTTKVDKHPVKTRKLIKFKIVTQEDLDNLIQNEIVPSKREMPMLIGKYNPKVQDCLPRIQAAMHTDSILRATPLLDLRPDRNETELVDEAKPLSGFLSSYIPVEAQPELHTLAVQLLDPSAKASVLITEYIDKQIQ